MVTMKLWLTSSFASLLGVALSPVQAQVPHQPMVPSISAIPGPFVMPPMPAWQTDARQCTWHWREGGGLGLWAETCDLSTGRWEVAWEEPKGAFVLRHHDQVQATVVKPWSLPMAAGMEGLTRALIGSEALPPDAPCHWQPIALRPAPRTMAFWVLVPNNPHALAPTAQGEVPEPVCGAYGVSTHGVRYFIVDLRWSGLAVSVDEGQERPMFDAASIVRLR